MGWMTRVRWLLKWAGLVACLLIAVVFAVSTRRAVHWTSSTLERSVGMMLGEVTYAWRPDGWRLENDRYAGSPGWSIGEFTFIGGEPKLSWWITRSANKAWVGISFPLWMPFLLLAVPTAVLWYRDRRLTYEAIRRFGVWICPRHPRRITFWLIVRCSLIHGLAVIPCLMVFHKVSFFFLGPGSVTFGSGCTMSTPSPRSWSLGQVVADRIVTWAAPCLFLGTPVWGVMWAWLYVRLLNRLFRRVRPQCCTHCGYDLTGNVSGICPECGKPVPVESSAEKATRSPAPVLRRRAVGVTIVLLLGVGSWMVLRAMTAAPEPTAEAYIAKWDEMGMWLPDAEQRQFFADNFAETRGLLAESLTHSKHEVRMRGAYVIEELGGQAKELSPAVVAALKTEQNELVRTYLINAFRSMEDRSAAVMALIRDAFAEPKDEEEKLYAAAALFVLSDVPSERDACEEYVCGFLVPSDDLKSKYSSTDYWDMRWSAVTAVRHMGGATKPIPLLEAMMTEPGAKPWVSEKVPRALDSLRKGSNSGGSP